MKKIHYTLIFVAYSLITFFSFFNSLKGFAIENFYEYRVGSEYCDLTVEIKDLKWHPFDNNLTIEIPDYILNKKVQRFSVKGRV